MRIGRELSEARRRAGMTQRQLAERAGVPQPTVARIERDTVSPRVGTLQRLLGETGQELSVQPRLGEGVDRSLIRDRLILTPRERIGLAVAEVRGMPVIRLRR
jgi:transcriptional regulator with XRE-family HTH domain